MVQGDAVVNKIIIFCGPGTAVILNNILAIYTKELIGINFVIVTPNTYKPNIEHLIEKYKIEITLDEDIEGFQEVSKWLDLRFKNKQKNNRAKGWYLQQYLKLAYCWTSKTPVFINDGDTIFSPVLLSKLLKKPELLTTRESPKIYNAFLEKINIKGCEKSFVANGGLFYPSELINLNQNPAEWFIKSLDICLKNHEDDCDFSEYQLMGSMLSSSLNKRELKLFRRFDLIKQCDSSTSSIKKIEKALNRYDSISYENFHKKSRVKKILIIIAFAIGYSW